MTVSALTLHSKFCILPNKKSHRFASLNKCLETILAESCNMLFFKKELLGLEKALAREISVVMVTETYT